IGCLVQQRGAGITWSEAVTHARAMAEGFQVVRSMGNSITPAPVMVMSKLPAPVIAGMFYLMSRTAAARDVGDLGTHEPRMLIDSMVAAAPVETRALKAIRP